MLNIIDSSELIDGLCENLRNSEFEESEDEGDLKLQVADLVSAYIEPALGEFASIGVEGRDRGKVRPVWAFGAEVFPDISVDVRSMPAVAVQVCMVEEGFPLTDALSAAIGRAVLCSAHYPYGIIFILDDGRSDLKKHWSDGELDARLWDNHRVSLIIRQ